VTLLASASGGCIRVWDGSDVLMKKKLDESETQYSYIDRKKMKREALWKIQLNEDEDSAGEESTAAESAVDKHRIGITSLATCQGRRLIAGTDEGKMHIWDVSSGCYEGSYSFGKNIQIWSLAVISEVEYTVEDEVVSVGVIVSGDNRGLRALKNVSSRYQELSNQNDFDVPMHDHREGDSLQSKSYSRGGKSNHTLREVDFG
jgi:WD40 repeat protein